MVNTKIFFVSVWLALTFQCIAEDLVYPLQDDFETTQSLTKILLLNRGDSIEDAKNRLKVIEPFIAENRNSRAALAAQLVYAADLVTIGIANAGDQRFEKGWKLQESILERHGESWEGAIAAIGLLGCYNIKGNQNVEGDWQRQIEIGKSSLQTALFSKLDENDDPYLRAFRIVGGNATGKQSREFVIEMLRKTYERLGKNQSELDEFLVSEPRQKLKNGATEKVSELSMTEKENASPKVKASESSKWPYGVVGITLLVVIAILICVAKQKGANGGE